MKTKTLTPEHQVKLPYCVRSPIGDSFARVKWCKENFGTWPGTWDYTISATGFRFYFGNEADMVLFILRWQ